MAIKIALTYQPTAIFILAAPLERIIKTMPNPNPHALQIIQLPALQDNYIYVLHDPLTQHTAVVDPSHAEPVLALLARTGWQLHTILNTHHHSDHVGGNLELKQKTACTIIASKTDARRIRAVDKTVSEGERIAIGSHYASVIGADGHTLGHILYYFASANALFCGDTLFAMGCGRLFEGSAAQMWHSLQKIKALPADTLCYCAHEYTQNNARFALSLEPDNAALQARVQRINALRATLLPTVPSLLFDELATNPFLREHSAELQQRIQRVGATPIEIFSEVRRLKDNF